MPNNFVRVGNLDDDAVVDEVKGKIRFENVITGTGAPTDPPPVPEKAWLYGDTTDDLAVVGYVWETDSEAWMPLTSSSATRRDVTLIVGAPTSPVEVGDGAMFFTVPPTLDGYNIVAIDAFLPGAVSSSGVVTVQLARIRSGSPVDVLSTEVTIDAGEVSSRTAVVPSVINTSNDDLLEYDILRVDIDAEGTSAAGLQVVVSMDVP